jgi:hypothetical protein
LVSIKKEAQIIAKQRNKKESLNYITSEFNKINNQIIKYYLILQIFIKIQKNMKKQ